MEQTRYETRIDQSFAESVVAAARTSVGDDLRSVVYFTPAAFDVLYVRSDLYESPAAARPAKAGLVEFERVGFAERRERSALSARGATPTVGPYEFTVRFHADGFVVRVLTATAGVLLTVDDVDVAAFEDAVAAIRGFLEGDGDSR